MVKADPGSSNGSGLEVSPGETEIVCRLSLAAGESCTVSISARLETRVAIQLTNFSIRLDNILLSVSESRLPAL